MELRVKARKRDGAMTGEEQVALDERGTKEVALHRLVGWRSVYESRLDTTQEDSSSQILLPQSMVQEQGKK